MTVYSLDPLRDSRWGSFLEKHPRASIFHTSGWLEALQRTYGYEPVAFTTTPGSSELMNGLVLCRVTSWLTGSRLVSVPFADHCEPLVGNPDCDELLKHLQSVADHQRLRYVEVRPLTGVSGAEEAFGAAGTFTFHRIDLRPSLADLFHRLHKDGIQRKIRRAEKEGIDQEEGQSDRLLRNFYQLLTLTRRRHKLPPQPIQWFEHIRECLGDRLNIRVARKNGRPIASILTLRYKHILLYKYGASDAEHHKSGAMPFLFWKAIQDAKAVGLEVLDLGRSDNDQLGLIRFKERLGATSSLSTYLRYPAPRRSRQTRVAFGAARGLVPLLPDALLIGLGKVLYRHLG